MYRPAPVSSGARQGVRRVLLQRRFGSSVCSWLVSRKTTSGGRRLQRGGVFAAIHNNHFHFGAIVAEIAARYHEIGDFAIFETAETVGNAIDFGRSERHGANGILARESGIDSFFDGALDVARLFQTIGVE